MEGVTFDSRPARALKADVTVMLQRTRDELPAIQQLWPRFERLVGLRGRRMYAMVTAGTYAACTPVRESDDPAALGLDVATLPGGWYLQARITGEPPALYERIGPVMQALEALASSADPARPRIEYYRRHDVIELWVPVAAQSRRGPPSDRGERPASPSSPCARVSLVSVAAAWLCRPTDQSSASTGSVARGEEKISV